MKDLKKNSLVIILSTIALSVSLSVSAETYSHLTSIISGKKASSMVSGQSIKLKVSKLDKSLMETQKISIIKPVTAEDIKKSIVHKRVKRWLHGKPSMINILIIDPKSSGAIVKPSFGSYFLNTMQRVKDIVLSESAIAGINASYFKPDNGSTLGISIIDNEIISGPLYRRVAFGITKEKEFKMGRVDISGDIEIKNKGKLSLFNLNLPVFSKHNRFTVFTDKFGQYTPKTSPYYSHVVIKDGKVSYVKNSRVHIPRNGFVIVGLHKYLPKYLAKGDEVNFNAKLTPEGWNDIEYAVGGGPYLVKKGKIFIDRQGFSKSFLWSKAPRSAIGYTKSGKLIFVTIDGRQEKYSEGATLGELAKIMWELGVYNAMNLDGGTSTQMVYNGKIVNSPIVKGGSRVNNALVIMAPAFSISN